MTILFDTIENKILSDRSVRGMLIFDEYAESQSIKDTFSGADIHSTVAFCYQKLRKENGAVGTIVQSMAQLPDNEYTKGIIANTQLLYVLPANEVVYDQTIEAFHIKNRSHINLMKSIRNDFTGTRPYSEIFLRFMDNYATVVRLELSPEKLLAFQTDGEKWNRLQEIYREVGSLETAIEQYKQLKHKDYETDFSM
jgi:type IV secretory pathway VirB4 component